MFYRSPIVRCALILLLSGPVSVLAQVDFASYRLEIQAPPGVTQLLRENLDLARWTDYQEMTPEVLARLVAEARGQAVDLLATEGYFTPKIDSRIDSANGSQTVYLTVDPGAPTTIRQVSIQLRGTVTTDPQYARRLAEIQDNWPLREGAVFRQRDWDTAKGGAVDRLAASRYAGASVAESRATIDPAAAIAVLAITLDSGPAFVFGSIAVTGLSKYPESAVRRLAPFTAGEQYEREKLERFQRRLGGTEYFASFQVVADPAAAVGESLPVKVSVIEAPSKRFEVSLGYSTDAAYRSAVEYRDANLFDSGIRSRSRLQIESKTQGLSTGLRWPTTVSGWVPTLAGQIQHEDIQNLVTDKIQFYGEMKRLDERRQPLYGMNYVLEDAKPDGAQPDTTYATMPLAGYVWRNVDDLVSPRSGYIASGQIGVSLPTLSSRRFVRTTARVQGFYPMSRIEDVRLRLEGGVVFADSRAGIPQALLFRTGGDETVRGYSFESLGVRDGTATVGGRYYGVASVEYTRWVGGNWGIATFVDAGNAVDDLNSWHTALGYGVGARLKSPVGPIRLDLAYGQDRKTFSIHFSAGVSF